MEKAKITLIDPQEENISLLQPANIVGINKKLLEKNRIEGNEKFGIKPMSQDTVNAVFSNAYGAIGLFANPSFVPEIGKNISKIIAIGKVQSGKTAFFISTVAIAFDNGYKLAIIIGGTKNPLKEQNYERVKQEFSNNQGISVLNFNYADTNEIEDKLSQGKKVILVVLKNPAENKNLGAVLDITHYFSHIPTLVVDDEGDEYTPGAPKTKSGTTRTHSVVSEIIQQPTVCTYLSVTATPQANLLIGTPDSVSPDYCVLVKPGKGYIGGIDFHDAIDNPHVQLISDSDDFKNTIPDSFDRALRYFILSCCIKCAQGYDEDYSMLVNPSSLTAIHSDIVSKIINRIKNIKQCMSFGNPAYDSELNCLEEEFRLFKSVNPESTITFSSAIRYIDGVLKRLSQYEYNATFEGRIDIDRSKNETFNKYKIFVGGSMLGRGLTIKNLIVTYIYNDSKITAIDTLYQRARWLGYKSKYFDVCRVYLTSTLQEKFMGSVESETDMWNSISAYLDTHLELKLWPRVFTLNNNKLILTRRSISKTIEIERINPGFTYSKSIWLSDEQKNENRKLAHSYLRDNKSNGYEMEFSNNGTQTAFIIPTTLTEFYESFISKYNIPRGSTLGPMLFKRLNEQAKNNEIPNELDVLFIRYKTGEFRRGINDNKAIKELPQGRNDGTDFQGDKNLPVFSNKLHIQIHMVYTKDGQSLNDATPIIALNNPITKDMINLVYVTGDNIYGQL